jgi:LPS O-antigen subunit length determinant protein (WzzB/FepE family)
MTEQSIPIHKDEEISLLDIFITLAESWRLLVFGPIIAGIMAGAFSYLYPKTFESQAILRLTDEDVALFHASPVLDPLITKFDLLKEADGIWDDARQDLKKQLLFVVDKKTKLVTLIARSNTPDNAQALATEAIVLLLSELKVKGKERELIEKIIIVNERAIQIAEDAVDVIQRGLKKSSNVDQAQESAVKNLSAINSDILKRRQENLELVQKLESRGLEIFVQRPSLPGKKSSPKLSLVLVGSVSISILLITIFVFLRKALNLAKQNVETAEKINTIQSLLGFNLH